MLLLKNLKLSTAILLMAAIVLSGCSVSGFFDPNRLSSAAFNNRFVDVVNVLMDNVEKLQETYTQNIPSELNAETKIDVLILKVSYEEMLPLKQKAMELTTLKSQNSDQEVKVIADFVTYLSALDAYLNAYNEMILFYSAEDFKSIPEDIEQVDKILKEFYKVYMDEHNDFVTLLESFK